jgi:hypothetical protein
MPAEDRSSLARAMRTDIDHRRRCSCSLSDGSAFPDDARTSADRQRNSFQTLLRNRVACRSHRRAMETLGQNEPIFSHEDERRAKHVQLVSIDGHVSEIHQRFVC